MASVHQDRRETTTLEGRCDCDGVSRAVTITRLGIEGCEMVAEDVWSAEDDFVHLLIGGTTEMNGRIVRMADRRVVVRFFGQLHPAAIHKLMADNAA